MTKCSRGVLPIQAGEDFFCLFFVCFFNFFSKFKTMSQNCSFPWLRRTCCYVQRLSGSEGFFGSGVPYVNFHHLPAVPSAPHAGAQRRADARSFTAPAVDRGANGGSSRQRSFSAPTAVHRANGRSRRQRPVGSFNHREPFLPTNQ
jgi:hypothetical protein